MSDAAISNDIAPASRPCFLASKAYRRIRHRANRDWNIALSPPPNDGPSFQAGTIPLARTLARGAIPRHTAFRGDLTDMLSGLHILLIEDQSLIALDTEAMLHELGASTVETLAAVEPALSWLDHNRPHAAVLDINLGTTSSFAIAEKLAQHSIPFIFTTGYGEDAAVPAQFSGILIVAKPYSVEAMGQALLACLGTAERH